MAFPSGRSETSGAIMLAACLILGGLLSYVCDRLNIPTPGLLLRRPSSLQVETVLRQAREDAGASASVSGAADSCEGAVAPGVCGTPKPGGSRPGVRAASPGAVSPRPRRRRLSPIEINNATMEELQQVDGIGPTLAGRIAEFRRANGPFHQMEDLLGVKGIGPSILARIRATAVLGEPAERPQNTFRTSISSQADSSSFQR
jgi:competence protein ComEA